MNITQGSHNMLISLSTTELQETEHSNNLQDITTVVNLRHNSESKIRLCRLHQFLIPNTDS